MSPDNKPSSSLVRRNSRERVNVVLKEAFEKLDVNHDGFVDIDELQIGLKNAGVKLSKQETQTLLEKYYSTSEGSKISFRDFQMIHQHVIDSIFNQFDTDKKGFLTEATLQQAMQKVGIAVTLAEAQTMMQQLEPVDAGKITKRDFGHLYLLLRAKMADSTLEAIMWDPDVRKLSKHWWKASVEVGESGLRIPLPDSQQEVEARGGVEGSTEVKKKIDPSVRFFAGALSGVIEALVLTPLDVTKTRLQLDTTGNRYKGMLDCGRSLLRQEGFFALYKGFTPWTMHVVTKNGTRFYFNAIYRKMLSDANGQVSGSKEFVAGAMAGATEAVLIVTPFEVIKTRLQGQDVVKGQAPKYKGPIHTALTVVKNEGPLALWKGLAPTIARQGLNQACSFWTNNWIKKNIWDLQEGETLPAYKSALTGMIGAIPGPCLNCPMDVIKTRLMAQENARGEAPKYKGTLHALRLIPKEEGISALYKGLLPRLSRLCPSYGIQWVVMDQVTAHFNK